MVSITPQQLAAWGLAGRLVQEQARDQLLQQLPPGLLAPVDEQQCIAAFLAAQGLTSQAQVQTWLTQQALSQSDLQVLADRHRRWIALCERQFGPKIPSLFLQKKADLDQAIYTILPFSDAELCSEIYQRLREQETSFELVLSQLPPEPSLGPRGRFGPVPLGELPEGLSQLLRVSKAGQLWPPKPIDQGWVLVRLEELRPVVLDQRLRQALLIELGNQWLSQTSTELGLA